MVMLLKILEVTFIAVASILTSSNGQGPTQSSGPVSGPLPGPDSGVCLTGQMKNVQSWTDDIGTIIADTDADTEREAIDLSSKRDPETILMQSMIRTVGPKKRVGFLSMARCQLTSVPPVATMLIFTIITIIITRRLPNYEPPKALYDYHVFGYRDSGNRSLSNTLQFLTLYGNQFDDNGLPGQRYDVMINATNATKQKLKIASFDKQEKSTWDVGFRNVRFPDLLELDLRSCRIQRLNGGIFDGMPSLQSLYLAENQIYYIGEKSFSKLSNLLHLDLSHNTAIDQKGSKVVLEWESGDVFSCLSNLRSLDLSLTPLSENSAAVFENLGKRFQRLSLCNTGVTNLKPYNFEKTSMKILDLSGNTGIMNDRRALEGLQSSLQVLYADSVGLKTLESLMHFTELQILKVSHNEISVVESEMTKTWPSLRILDLDNNKLNSWSGKVFSRLHNLDILSMRNNNINLIKARMLHDLRNVSYLAMSGNFFVCTCYNREFFEIAANNEKNYQAPNNMLNASVTNNVTKHHVGYYEFYNKIINRNIVKRDCGNKMHGKKKLCGHEVNSDIDGVFLLIDYERNFYNCFLIDKAETMEFSQVEPCNVAQRDLIYDEYIKVGWRKVVVIGTSVTLAMVLLILGYVFRRSFWYFYITVKNSALLSLMAESEGYEDGSIFNYDVFVSYCNEDRPWVLDHLLPHVEKDCNVSVCLHERDFQVGLSILENIVSCMDRSRSIMLVISQRFLLSQWCQFEMHLAQHRLLETRREDLILILLEDIPRRLRPNTLHYLMMTKTYVLWPKDPTEQTIFWKRLKKSLVTRKLKQTDNDSLA